MESDRNTKMWSKVVTDPDYRALAQKIWAQDNEPPDANKRAELDRGIDEQITKAIAAVRSSAWRTDALLRRESARGRERQR